MQVLSSPEVHDVVVIGSGAGGGTIVQVLTEKGIRVTLLEAGPMLDPYTDFKEHTFPYEVDHRGAKPGGDVYLGKSQWSYFSAPNGFWQSDDEPFTVAPGNEFRWMRSRILGGRTNHYGRISLRFSDYDFKPYSFDGLGTDWPISYDELAPYYDRIERFIGVTGSREGLRTAPDGIFQTPPPPKVHEILIQKACGALGIPCIANRRAVITAPLNGRPACHYCGNCWRGCMTGSNYSSSTVQILPALETGKLEIRDLAMAREILSDDEGRVTAVSYIDKRTRTERQIRCRAVVLAASACESARLLLNSRSPRFPAGLANNSGVVGRYLMDTVGFGLWGRTFRRWKACLATTPMASAPRISTCPGGSSTRRTKSFHAATTSRSAAAYSMPMIGSFGNAVRRVGGYGTELKRGIRTGYGAYISLAGRGEMIPNHLSYCEIDPEVTDRWGIPVPALSLPVERLRVETGSAHGTNDRRDHRDHGRRGRRAQQPRTRGQGHLGSRLDHPRDRYRTHGSDPRTSALNGFCQAHEVPNLFVADAGPFVSNPDKNPTLTIKALAWRTADYLSEQMRTGVV